MDRDRVERIHQQLAEIRQRGTEFPNQAEFPSWLKVPDSDARQFKLRPPIDPNVLNAFEEKHQIQLPAQYRDFLLQVSDGGAGPYTGLRTLEQSQEESGGNLQAPNPFVPEEDAQPGWFERFEDDENYNTIDDGALQIVSDGVHERVLLIVSGPYRGRIVERFGEFDYPPIFTLFPDFLSWYETWLRETLAGYEMRNFGRGLPLDQDQSLAVAIDVQESAVRRKAAINNLLRAPSLQPDQHALLQGALLKENDADFASNMLVKLLKDGVTGLEQVSWQFLKRTQSKYYERVITAMRNAGVTDWVQAAEWAIDQDADNDSVSDLLCGLKNANKLTNQFIQKVFSSQYHVGMALYLNSKRPEPVPIPTDFFTHPDPGIRQACIWYSSAEELEVQLPRLLELFPEERNEEVRKVWVFALTRSYGPRIVNALIKHLDTEEYHSVRSAIVRQLGEVKSPEAVPALLATALNDNSLLASEAVISLGKIGTAEAKTALETIVSTQEVVFKGTGQGIVIYPKFVIDESSKQLQALNGAAEE